MMPKFTESSTDTSVVAIHTIKAAAAYLRARLTLLRENVHIQPAINKNTQLILARQISWKTVSVNHGISHPYR